MTDSYKGAPSAAENAVSAVAYTIKHKLGLDRIKPGNLADNPPAPSSPGGNYTKRDEYIDKTTSDAETGNDSTQASNAGRQAQSTDHMNQY
jgi:hypothetical protein